MGPMYIETHCIKTEAVFIKKKMDQLNVTLIFFRIVPLTFYALITMSNK